MLKSRTIDIRFMTGEEKTGNPKYVMHDEQGEPVRITDDEYYVYITPETIPGTIHTIDIDETLERGRRMKEQFEQIKITAAVIEFRSEEDKESKSNFVPDLPFESLSALDEQYEKLKERYVCNPAPGEKYIDFQVKSSLGTGFIFEMTHPLVGNMYISLNRICNWIGCGWCDFFNIKPVRDIKHIRIQYVVEAKEPMERLKSKIANRMMNKYSGSRLDVSERDALSEAIDVFFKPNRRSQGGQID